MTGSGTGSGTGSKPGSETCSKAGVRTVAAVDLGASSGRVMLGRVGPDTLVLEEANRFPNRPVRVGSTLHWDILGLYAGVLDGLRTAGDLAGGPLDSIGVDSWAVDYGLLDADGALLGNPVHYRDERTAAIPEISWLYRETGIQHAPFNTIYQLLAARGGAQFAAAERLLLIPDLIAYWLTGVPGTELTNASTTQLIDPRTRDWAAGVAAELGLDLRLVPPLRQPGDRIGPLLPHVATETGLAPDTPVTAVASHDTASAVVAVPATGPDFAYISCGTWSLAGVELTSPVLSAASQQANFTNELGVDGTVRYLRNIMGLWLLQECMREWGITEVEPLLRAAADVPGLRCVVDAADSGFLTPGAMTSRIAEACRVTGQPVPATPAEYTRCVLDSLALAHRRAVRDAVRLTGQDVAVIHLVGGGARNTLLCQLTADACGMTVVAGPAEATALGNVLIQARAHGMPGDLPTLRRLVSTTQELRHFQPSPDSRAWERVAARVDVT
jgi:rhamnulokinase